MTSKHLTVIGAGAWGKTLAQLATDQGHRVKLWSRSDGEPLAAAIAGADILVSAVSMKGVRAIADQVRACGPSPSTILVSATKGLEPETALTPTQIWQDRLPNNPIVVLSGPNLSKEIQQKLPTASVVASRDPQAAEIVQEAFSSALFRVYTSGDPLGVELGGTLKNVMAIAAGVCDGLNLGTNAKAALMTRSLAEIIRIGTHWGASAATFYGLSGLGDLLATSSSPLSRNYQIGYGLAQGKSLAEILTHLEGTAEGINTTQVMVQRADRYQISVPVTRQIDCLLRGETTPQRALSALMQRDTKSE